jgi:hypothetical protein
LVGWIGATIVVVSCLVGTVLLNSSWDAAGDFYDTRSRRFCSDEWSLPVYWSVYVCDAAAMALLLECCMLIFAQPVICCKVAAMLFV